MKTKTHKINMNEFGSFLGRNKGCLVLRDRAGTEKRYPLFENEICDIQIRSGNSISSGVLATCGFWNIPVTVLTSRGHPVAVMRSLDDDSHVKTRIAQYESLNNGKQSEIAKTFLLSKLEGQNKLLTKCGLKRLDYYHLSDRIKSIEGNDMRLLRTKLTNIEGHCAERYFEQLFGILNERIRPERRKGFKSFDAINNLFNLGYTILKWKVHLALLSAKLEPYLGYLHEIVVGRPSLVCDFLELYRYLMDDFLIEYARNLRPRDFVLKDEDYSSTKKGKRQYLNDKMQREYLKKLNAHFLSKVEIPRIRKGEHQEIETLINEEALLFAAYLRDERPTWHPRIVDLN
jgi:CRISPR-associated protein Cas1